MADAPAPFVFGAGGARMTPEQIEAQRKVAQALMAQGMDYSPIRSPWQGVARVAQGLLGGLESREADEAAKANQAADRELIASLLTGGGAPAAAPTAAAGTTSAAPVEPSAPLDLNTPGVKTDFVSSVTPAAIEASKSTGLDPRLIVAQAALESGYGQHAPGNNLFGIKSHGQPGGNVLPTTEVVNGQPVQTTDSFRAYASPADSVAGYADFINSNPRYAAVKGAQGLDAQIQAMGASGYATDPQYGAKLASIARSLPQIGPSGNGLNYPNTFAPSDAPAPPVTGPTTNNGLQYPNIDDAAPNAQPTQARAPVDVAAIPPYPQAAAPSQVAPPIARPVAAPAAAPVAPAQPRVNPALIGALTSPYSSPATKAVAQILLKQQMASPEYVPIGDNAILDKRSGRITPVDVNKKTNDLRNLDAENASRAAQGLAPMTPLEFITATKKAGAQNITVDQRGENEYSKVNAKHFADMNMDLIKGAITSRGSLSKLDRMGQLLADPNVYTGTGGEAVLGMKRLAKSMGIDVGDLSGSEAVAAIGNEMALELRNPAGGAGMPGAMSDRDREFLQTMPPGLGKTREGNLVLLDYRKRLAQRSLDVDRLRQQYVQKNGRLDEGFFQQLSQFSEANPLFPEGASVPGVQPPAGNKTKSGVTWSVE